MPLKNQSAVKNILYFDRTFLLIEFENGEFQIIKNPASAGFFTQIQIILYLGF